MPVSSVLERPRRIRGAAAFTAPVPLEPRIQYARTQDSIDIAYYTIGSGEPLVALAGGGGLSHLAREWQYPEQRAWVEGLSANHRVIRMDFRGSGLSDRDVVFDLESAVRDIDAVVEREGLQRFTLLGQLHTAGTAILYAALHPDRVARLILWSPFTNYEEFLASSPPLQAARAAAAKDWATYTELVALVATAWTDIDQARRLAAYYRDATNETQYRTAMERFTAFDVSGQLSALTMPVLVMHRREALFPSIELVSRVASDVASARLVLLSGSGALPFVGNLGDVLSAIAEFLAQPMPRSTSLGLTQRETEILAFLAGGASNKEIARSLSISTRTVERHIGNVYTKIGAHNRAQATAYAFRHGIAMRS